MKLYFYESQFVVFLFYDSFGITHIDNSPHYDWRIAFVSMLRSNKYVIDTAHLSKG